jgi:hypothetical protein
MSALFVSEHFSVCQTVQSGTIKLIVANSLSFPSSSPYEGVFVYKTCFENDESRLDLLVSEK